MATAALRAAAVMGEWRGSAGDRETNTASTGLGGTSVDAGLGKPGLISKYNPLGVRSCWLSVVMCVGGFVCRAIVEGTWQTSLRNGDVAGSEELTGRFWIFVNLAGHGSELFVVPAGWMASDIHRAHQDYLRQNDGARPRSPGSDHHGITVDRIEQWRDRWDLLG